MLIGQDGIVRFEQDWLRTSEVAAAIEELLGEREPLVVQENSPQNEAKKAKAKAHKTIAQRSRVAARVA